MKEKLVSASQTTSSELIMPNDTNPLGNLMGGNLMRWIDIVGGICAGKHSEAHVVTASVDHVSFNSPIYLGDVITLTASVTRAFNTSLEVYVEVHSSSIKGSEKRKTNHAYLTFVAIDDITKKPKSIPPLRAVSTQELEMYNSAPRRRELRLILSGRIKAQNAELIKDYFKNM